MPQTEIPPNHIVNTGSVSEAPVTIAVLPQSTMQVKRVSLKDCTMMSPDSF